MSIKPVFFVALAFVFFGLATCGAVDFKGATLNSLTKKQYFEFCGLIAEQYKTDADELGRQAHGVLVGMLGLEAEKGIQKAFEIDTNFNINAMLLLVANANKIKRETAFIEEFKRQASSTSEQITDDEQKAFLKFLTTQLIAENAKLD